MSNTEIHQQCRYGDALMEWLADVLEERFGFPVFLQYVEPRKVALSVAGDERRVCIVVTPDVFSRFGENNMPFSLWNVEEDGFESVFGGGVPAPGVQEVLVSLVEEDSGGLKINYDILGLMYWMLARNEEVFSTGLDVHRRFTSKGAHAFKHGYLERPIVDEWLDILKQIFLLVWPSLKFKKNQFSIKVSHDVDRPSRYANKSFKGLAKSIAKDVIVGRELAALWRGPVVWGANKGQLHPYDPYNTFSWLMDISEKNNIQSAFYFICGGCTIYDADYSVKSAAIRSLIRNISERQHEIGLHPSYGSIEERGVIAQELGVLKAVCQQEGVVQEKFGGRMHYLRWEHPRTMQEWNEAGMQYDSTLGYADAPGFRCGTCFEFPAFDSLKQEQYRLRIRPLIVMEASIATYLGLGYSEAALNKVHELKENCRKVGGMFTMLWHNSELVSSAQREVYRMAIEAR